MKQINTNKYLKVGALKNWLAQFDDDVEVVIDTTGLHSDLLGDEDGDDVFPIQALSGRVTPDREQAVNSQAKGLTGWICPRSHIPPPCLSGERIFGTAPKPTTSTDSKNKI